MRKFLSILFIIAGLALASYPWISNFINERAADGEISVYSAEINNMDAAKKQEYLETARKYNAELLNSRIALVDPFDLSLQDIYTDTPYMNILNYDSQGIMGFLEVPCIDVKLPIYHGTAASVLEKGVGHLEGSSFPVGGASTHSVLTGHTGLNKAKLFTDLTAVKEGDLFFINILDEKLAYRVDQISVVLPEDTTKLQIIKGEDHVTLVTCTPYGINDHRLLVRGTRTEYSDVAYDNEQNKDNVADSLWMQSYRNAFLIGLAITAILLLVFFIIRKIKEKKGGAGIA